MKTRHVGWSRVVCTIILTAAVSCPLQKHLSAEDFDWRNVGGLTWNTPVQNQGGILVVGISALRRPWKPNTNSRVTMPVTIPIAPSKT